MHRLALLAALLPACFSDPGLEDTSATAATTGPDPTTTTTSTTAATCSDGLMQAPEECDEGPLNGDFAECRENCKLSFCGDGFAGPTEECDDGDGVDDNACRNDCTLARCGDGVVFSTREECDDGNLEDGDACSSRCTDPRCGDGAVDEDLDEECDWAELNGPGSGCTGDCKLATCGDGFTGPAELCDAPDNPDCVDCRPTSCGNGMLERGEQCDGSPTCTPQCTSAACGDNIINNGEECDDGNPFDDDGCNTACQLVTCGDGKQVLGEVCDDDMTPDDGCNACQRDAYFVFVTEQPRKGNLGGLQTADALCQQEAAAAGLPGTYRVWLSDSLESPATRFSRSSRPYILPGTPPIPIAGSWAELVAGALKHPIDRTAKGVQVDSASSCENTEMMAWTHSRATAGPFKDNPCSNWLVDSGTAVAGLLAESGLSWTEGCPGIACNKALRLYCFEQP